MHATMHVLVNYILAVLDTVKHHKQVGVLLLITCGVLVVQVQEISISSNLRTLRTMVGVNTRIALFN